MDAVPGNAAPTFDDDSATSRWVEENSVEDANVGGPVAATNPEGDELTYELSSDGTDADLFSIDANGLITVASGANLDHEAKSSYSVTGSVHDRKDIGGLSDTTTIDDTITVTIELSNVAEVPTRPDGFTANAGNAQVTPRWDNPSDGSITGRRYLSERQVAKLTTGDRAANDYLGYSVSVNGDTAVVGAYGDDNSKGAAYVLVRQSGAWSQVAKLTASDGQDNDEFGRSVAVDGDTVVVGAVVGDGGVGNAGAAYVFTKPDTGWANASETVKLTPSDWAAADSFGISVALDEDTIVVGAYQVNHVDGDGNPVSNSGAAYVFTRQEGAWS